jgi:hypothetical protein
MFSQDGKHWALSNGIPNEFILPAKPIYIYA